MNCIIGAENTTCESLGEFIKKSDSLSLVATFTDSESIRDYLSRKNEIDLVFIDNDLPGLDVFNFISTLDYKPNLIMVSADYQDAFRAFDFDVVDYLLKPLSYVRFCRAVDKAVKFYSRKEVSSSTDNDMFIKKGASLVKIKLKNVVYIEALENYVTLYTKDEKFTIHLTLKSVDNQLPAGMFIRVHRSFIVNKSMIQTIKESSLEVMIGNKIKSIPIGNSYRDPLLNAINVMAR